MGPGFLPGHKNLSIPPLKDLNSFLPPSLRKGYSTVSGGGRSTFLGTEVGEQKVVEVTMLPREGFFKETRRLGCFLSFPYDLIYVKINTVTLFH